MYLFLLNTLQRFVFANTITYNFHLWSLCFYSFLQHSLSSQLSPISITSSIFPVVFWYDISYPEKTHISRKRPLHNLRNDFDKHILIKIKPMVYLNMQIYDKTLIYHIPVVQEYLIPNEFFLYIFHLSLITQQQA